jgi:hypothetical protein
MSEKSSNAYEIEKQIYDYLESVNFSPIKINSQRNYWCIRPINNSDNITNSENFIVINNNNLVVIDVMEASEIMPFIKRRMTVAIPSTLIASKGIVPHVIERPNRGIDLLIDENLQKRHHLTAAELENEILEINKNQLNNEKTNDNVQYGHCAIIPNDNMTIDLEGLQNHSTNNIISQISFEEVEKMNNSFLAMKQDDIIIIPSGKFGELRIGIIITSDIISDCMFKKVKWFDNISNTVFNSHSLHYIYNTDETIQEINDYAPFIERALNSFYEKDDQSHLTLRINSPLEQYALDIPTFITGLIDRALSISKELNLPYSEKDIKVRINVQCPGIIELFSNPCFIALVAIVFVSIFGGKIEIDSTDTKGNKTKFKMGTKGLPNLLDTLHNVNNKYDNRDNRYRSNNLKEISNRIELSDPRNDN